MKNLHYLFAFMLVLILNSALLAQSCQQLNRNYFVCGVPTNEFNYSRAQSINGGRQIQSNWCWAACIQMALNYHGLYVSQVDIVTKIYGSPYVNAPAGTYEILQALSGWAPDTRGRYSRIRAISEATSAKDLVNLLSRKWPLIVGLYNSSGNIGHAYVLTGIYYSYEYDYYGNVVGVIPDKVVLRDPWPGSSSRQEMSWSRFQRQAEIVIKVWVERW